MGKRVVGADGGELILIICTWEFIARLGLITIRVVLASLMLGSLSADSVMTADLIDSVLSSLFLDWLGFCYSSSYGKEQGSGFYVD